MLGISILSLSTIKVDSHELLYVCKGSLTIICVLGVMNYYMCVRGHELLYVC